MKRTLQASSSVRCGGPGLAKLAAQRSAYIEAGGIWRGWGELRCSLRECGRPYDQHPHIREWPTNSLGSNMSSATSSLTATNSTMPSTRRTLIFPVTPRESAAPRLAPRRLPSVQRVDATFGVAGHAVCDSQVKDSDDRLPPAPSISPTSSNSPCSSSDPSTRPSSPSVVRRSAAEDDVMEEEAQERVRRRSRDRGERRDEEESERASDAEGEEDEDDYADDGHEEEKDTGSDVRSDDYDDDEEYDSALISEEEEEEASLSVYDEEDEARVSAAYREETEGEYLPSHSTRRNKRARVGSSP